jgi:GGDEF domain-containing protein
MIISLKKLWDREDPGETPRDGREDAMFQAVYLLIEGMGTHALRVGGALDSNLEELPALLSALQPEIDPLELLAVTTRANEVMETHNHQVAALFRRRVDEFQQMISLMAKTFAATASVQGRAVSTLQEVARKIEDATGFEDVGHLKDALGRCLDAVRAEVEKQKADGARAEREASERIRSMQERLNRQVVQMGSQDSLLAPARDDAPAQEKSSLALVIACDGLDSISLRYGEALKHKVLGRIADHIKSNIQPGDRCVRWKGASFVIFMEREGREIEATRAAVAQHLNSLPEEAYFDLGDRSVMLHMQLHWTVLITNRYTSHKEIFAAIDQFVDQRSRTRKN